MQWLQSMTPQRVSNAARLLASFYYSWCSGRLFHAGWPAAVTVEPTTACNLRCPQCPSGLRSFTRPTGRISLDLYRSVIDQTFPHAAYLTLYFQGEPMMHPYFVDLVDYARRKKLYTVTSTNGHFIDRPAADELVRSGLSRLIVSVDGVTQQAYEQYRVGGSLERVLQSIRYVSEAKRQQGRKYPIVVLQFLIGRHNEHQVDAMRFWAKQLPANHAVFKTMQLYDDQAADRFLPQQSAFARYRRTGNVLQPKHRMLNRCWRLWHSCVVTWDGKVVPCCFDKDARYVMGDLRQESLQKIWRGERYRAFRRRLFGQRDSIDICTNCSEGARVYFG